MTDTDDVGASLRYRQHAEELRTIAAGMADPNSRGTILQIADDYEQMAQSRERIAQSERERMR